MEETRELLSPLVSVEVLEAANGERVLIPSTYVRHIMHKEWEDIQRLRRVSFSGGVAGAIAFNMLGIVHIASSTPQPYDAQLALQHSTFATQYMRDLSATFVESPAGADAILIDEPIRGVIPAPIISQVRYSTPVTNWLYEDLFPAKYKYDFQLPGYIYRFVPPLLQAPTYYGCVGLLQTAKDTNGNFYVIPVLLQTAHEMEASILGLHGNFLLAYPAGADVVRICSQGNIINRDALLYAAYNNTKLVLEQNAVLTEHPAAIKYLITPSDFRYDVTTGEWKDSAQAGYSFMEVTLASFLAQSPPIPIPDYAFWFVIQLNTPTDQRYHVYSMSAGARIFFGNHYMLEFVPSAGGVAKTLFYFFPFGYYVDINVWLGMEPAVNPDALVFGSAATIQGFRHEFSLKWFQPQPVGTDDRRFVAPYTFVSILNEADVWSLSKISPGATGEAFMVLPIKGHICILKLSDIYQAVATGRPVKPIFAFNPMEYVHRNFGNSSLGVTLMNYFKEQTIPANSTVGLFVYNANAYISFCDFAWRGASIQTKPTILAPALMIPPGNTLMYLPFILKGTSPNLPRVVGGLGNLPQINWSLTQPPSIPPITPVPPTVTEKAPHAYGVFPVLHAIFRDVTHPDFEPIAAGVPKVEVCREPMPGVAASVSPTTAVSLRITLPSSKCQIIQSLTRIAEGMVGGFGRLGGLIPATDLGVSPSYFPDAESFQQAWRELLLAQPAVLYEVKMASGRFVPAPPVLLAVDLVRAAVFTLGDYKWNSAINLAEIEPELGATTSVVKAVTINLTSELGSSSAQVVLELPYNVEPIQSAEDNLIISLPPALRRILRPYNLIRIRLGYTLETEKEFEATLSPVIFEGVITNVGASVSAEAGGGARVLRVTITANDLFYRAALSTTEQEPPMDGWFLPEIIEHQMINSGINPQRLISHLWFPMGAVASYLVGDTLFVGGTDAYLTYSDYPFHFDLGLKALVDAPRYLVAPGARRLDVIKQALRLAGAEMIFTPYPVSKMQLDSFIDFVLKSLPYERFSSTVAAALQYAKLPYDNGYVQLPKKEGEQMWAQVMPIGSYSTRPTLGFQIQRISIPAIDQIPLPPALLNVPIVLPTQPFVYGIFSLQWENTAWPIPTLVNIEGERIWGQPFYFSFYDYYHELYDPNTIAFKGFRISSHAQRNPNIVDPLQAFLAAMREYLKVGYFPPIKATLTLFGMPVLGVKHLIAITPAIKIFGAEDFIVTDPSGGASFWVVNTITYEWNADAPIPRMTISLTPPHRFLVGLFGLG